MGEIEEVQEKMKADMEDMKDQITFMMENNVAAVAATSAATEADPTHPSAINQTSQPILDMVGQGGEVLGSTGGPHMRQNRNFFPI